MKKLAIFAVLAAGLTGPAVAQTAAAKAEVVETNARGQAIKVRIEGKVYDVCMNEAQDGCIQPRAAGLNWGDVPLDHWPGEAVSERGARTASAAR
jgi:hypothetical protein